MPANRLPAAEAGPGTLLYRTIDEFATTAHDTLTPRELYALGVTLSILEGNDH